MVKDSEGWRKKAMLNETKKKNPHSFLKIVAFS